jgi:hypothetical protein
MDKIEGTVLGDNKFVIIPMEEKETVELDVNELTEFKELFKNINDVEEVIDTLHTSGDSISANDITKTIITLIKANQDNTETILNFLLYIAYHEMRDLQIKYSDLIIKVGKGFYDSGMEDARHCDCCSEEVTTVSNLNDALKENSDVYDSDDNQKPLFDEDNEYDKASTLWDDHMKEIREKLNEDHNHNPEFEILGPDEVEEI